MSKSKFGFIQVASIISNMPLDEIASETRIQLSQVGGELFDETRIGEDHPLMYFILTGGTEQKVLELYTERKKYFNNEPVFLLAHNANNSLAASIEILAKLQQGGVKGKIIYCDETSNKDYLDDLEKLIKHFGIYHSLKRMKIGLIGEPSDWLVASMPEADTIKNIWGPEIVRIELEELKEQIAQVKDEEIEDAHFNFTKKATEIKEPSKKEVKQVVKVYTALKKIVNKYELNAVSVRCFDLVVDLKTTGCFALSKLNDDGIIAGCEGDLVSTLGMIWTNMLTDQTVWMANPSQLDEQNNSMILAHCTIPISLVQSYKLRSHFESGLGVGIQGELTKGKITLVRLGGNNLNKIWITAGEILESTASENLCRTQVSIKLHGSAKVTDLLTNPLGNHLLMLRGNYVKELNSWWQTFVKTEE
jgi:L-fucose isomerase-like protein